MSVSAIGAVGFVPPVLEARPPNAEAGDGRTDEVAGGRTTESDGSRRVVLARGGESRSSAEGEERERPEARAATDGETEGARTATDAQRTGRGRPDDAEGSDPAAAAAVEGEEEVEQGELTSEEEQVVQEMKARDAEVRAHEMAHVAAGGAHVTGGPTYSYQNGPDGRRYAVGGEVSIDTSPEEDPQATIMKMMQVRAAALAPAEPSGADRAVAASAAQTAAQARAELAKERMEGTEGEDERTTAAAEPAESAGAEASPEPAPIAGTESVPRPTDAPAEAPTLSVPEAGGAESAPAEASGRAGTANSGLLDRARARYETDGQQPQLSSILAVA